MTTDRLTSVIGFLCCSFYISIPSLPNAFASDHPRATDRITRLRYNHLDPLVSWTTSREACIDVLVTRSIFGSSSCPSLNVFSRWVESLTSTKDLHIIPHPRPGSWRAALRETTNRQETERLMTDSPPGITAAPNNDNLRHFDVTVAGPESSPYEGEWWAQSLTLALRSDPVLPHILSTAGCRLV